MDDNALTEYMAGATRCLVRRALVRSLRSPSTVSFILRFSRDAKRASKIRSGYQSRGIHVPGFLICSITTDCNLRCKGCYAVSNGICGTPSGEEMTDEEWASVFSQANGLGISFIILAGGEPLMRPEILAEAARYRDMVFPVFTNGTMISDDTSVFRENRNLIPIVSLDGNKEETDERRGRGVFDKAVSSIRRMERDGLFHGVSVTVTSENIDSVVSEEYISFLESLGTHIVFLIEFVPSAGTEHLALGDGKREMLAGRVSELRSTHRRMMFMSFPGDERFFGGCIGAGRGFFHINPYGDAEACPASPFHDVNLRECKLTDAISSSLFVRIRDSELISLPHSGGCALSEHASEVRLLTEKDITDD
ncbi:MAG: radical SAM/SPASM domain-containing protein [Candidatus Methanomethylophilaceae archaeon]